MQKRPTRKPRGTDRRPPRPPRRADRSGTAPGSAGLRLEEDLAATEGRLRGIDVAPAPDERSSSGGDSVFDETDHIHTSQAQEIRFATRERLVERVERIRAALDRLARGEYGRCIECGEPIGRARLEAMPEVERCVRCQERAERRRAADGGRAA